SYSSFLLALLFHPLHSLLPPRPPPRSPLFPYTTLFRSAFYFDYADTAGTRIIFIMQILQLHVAKSRNTDAHSFCGIQDRGSFGRSEEHTSELQSRFDLVCRLLLVKKKRMT